MGRLVTGAGMKVEFHHLLLSILAMAIAAPACAQSSGPDQTTQVTVIGRCPDDPDGLAIKAINAAIAFAPGPDSSDIRERRRSFLVHNLGTLFDPDGTGYIDLTRYGDFIWAFWVSPNPPVDCRIDFDAYYELSYGPADPTVSASEARVRRTVLRPYFNGLARAKGYITQADYTNKYAHIGFTHYKPRDGRVPVAQVQASP